MACQLHWCCIKQKASTFYWHVQELLFKVAFFSNGGTLPSKFCSGFLAKIYQNEMTRDVDVQTKSIGWGLSISRHRTYRDCQLGFNVGKHFWHGEHKIENSWLHVDGFVILLKYVRTGRQGRVSFTHKWWNCCIGANAETQISSGFLLGFNMQLEGQAWFPIC